MYRLIIVLLVVTLSGCGNSTKYVFVKDTGMYKKCAPYFDRCDEYGEITIWADIKAGKTTTKQICLKWVKVRNESCQLDGTKRISDDPVEYCLNHLKRDPEKRHTMKIEYKGMYFIKCKSFLAYTMTDQNSSLNEYDRSQ